ncbi:MAG: hypothetical protein P8Q20_10775 [Acidimicrobiales bacterium]|nr:hypothetical protein [Acidimicrobiales bacterium]
MDASGDRRAAISTSTPQAYGPAGRIARTVVVHEVDDEGLAQLRTIRDDLVCERISGTDPFSNENETQKAPGRMLRDLKASPASRFAG